MLIISMLQNFVIKSLRNENEHWIDCTHRLNTLATALALTRSRASVRERNLCAQNICYFFFGFFQKTFLSLFHYKNMLTNFPACSLCPLEVSLFVCKMLSSLPSSKNIFSKQVGIRPAFQLVGIITWQATASVAGYF